jgi:DNA-binding protein WhiA
VRTRRHLDVRVDRAGLGAWRWREAPACDRRSFLRGALLGSGSISLTSSGAHVEFVLRSVDAAAALRDLLGEMGVRSGISERRNHHVVYLKGQDDIVALLGLMGANRGVLELETQRVGRDVQSRLNRLLNAEEANLGRTVGAADRQLLAIDRLERDGTLARLTPSLQETAATRRRMPDADLDTLASALGVSRSAVNHRLRKLVDLTREEDA